MKYFQPKKFFFIKCFNTDIEKKLKKHHYIGVIYMPINNVSLYEVNKILKANLTNQIFISGNFNYIPRRKINGIHLTNTIKKKFNKNNKYGLNYLILSTAYSLNEIFQKIRQGCDIIFFSNVYKTTSHPERNNFLGLMRFLNIRNQIKNVTILPLGGITKKRYNSLNILIKNFGYGGVSSF